MASFLSHFIPTKMSFLQIWDLMDLWIVYGEQAAFDGRKEWLQLVLKRRFAQSGPQEHSPAET